MTHTPLMTMNDRSILHAAPVDHGGVYLVASRHFITESQSMEERFHVVHVQYPNLEALDRPVERVTYSDTRLIGAMEVYNACVAPNHAIPTTISPVAHAVKEAANQMLRDSQDFVLAERRGIIALVERVLHDADQYKGFQYLPSELDESGQLRKEYDDTRRRYF